MRSCAEYEALISALLDGELSAEEQADTQAHIASCPQCRAMYEAFAALSAVEAEAPPESLHADIMKRVGAARKAAKTQRTIMRLRPILASAACLVVIVGTMFGVRNLFRAGSAAPESEALMAAPKMSMMSAAPAASEEDQSAQYASGEENAEAADTASPAAPAAPMAPEMLGSAPQESEAADSELSSVLLEVISFDETAIEVRDFKVNGTLTVRLTEETEISDEVRGALGPGCVISVLYDLAQAEQDLQITAAAVLLAE